MKKKVMLIVPMLHQGGFERVCVALDEIKSTNDTSPQEAAA